MIAFIKCCNIEKEELMKKQKVWPQKNMAKKIKKLLRQAFHDPKKTPNQESFVLYCKVWKFLDHNNILSALSLTAVFLRQFNPLLARGTLISRCKKFKQVPQLYRGSPLSFLPSFFFFVSIRFQYSWNFQLNPITHVC
jgi:hypothetical protein